MFMGHEYYVCNCRHCLNMDLKDRNRYDDAYCSHYRKYYNPNDKACSGHFKYDEQRNPTNSGCYLTTTLCNVLGYSDDCNYLSKLRDFRDTYLKTKSKYLGILKEYDIVGPIISDSIREDDKNTRICKMLEKRYLEQIVSLITTKRYTKAIKLYMEMTNNLKILYGVDNIAVDKKNYKYDIKTLGKART